MKPLQLNFSRQALRRKRRRDWSVLVLSLLLLVFVGREAFDKQTQLQLAKQQYLAERENVVQMIVPLDPEKQKLARSMARSLNLPWYELLQALESVKTQHPDVFLKSILPDARKQQVLISGEVKRLDQLLAYIDSLNQHELFGDALPVSQQQTVPVSNGMTFTLKLEWHHE